MASQTVTASSATNTKAATNPSFAKSALKTALKIAFAVALILWLVKKGALDFKAMAALASPGLVLFCLGCVFGQIFVNNYRWLCLLRGQGFKMTIGQTLPLSFIGMFFNFAMPGGVGGDVVKGYYLLQENPTRRFPAAVSIFMDRMMGFFVMIGTAFLALFLNWEIVEHSPQLTSIAFGVSALFLGFLVFFALSFSTLIGKSTLAQKIFDKVPGGARLRSLYEILHSYRHQPTELLIAIAMSGLNQILMVAFVVAIGQAMNIDLPLAAYFFLVPIGSVIQALPISPAGIGVGQAAFYYLFNQYLHTQSQLGPTAVTATQLASFAWGLLGAFFYLRRKKPVELAT
jgi:glycosyltransferase 2 family protein